MNLVYALKLNEVTDLKVKISNYANRSKFFSTFFELWFMFIKHAEH